MQKIIPFLWYHNEAQEAVDFYTLVFSDVGAGKTTYYDFEGAKVSGQEEGSIMTIEFSIRDQKFVALNGGPVFDFTPAISFFVPCTLKTIDGLFVKLSEGGKVLMPLDKYDFSDRYAWVQDKYGVSWQLILSPNKHITPCFLFVKESLGKAKIAIDFYTSVFKDAAIKEMVHYKDKSLVMFSSFVLENQEFSAMDGVGEHDFAFNESISFMVQCNNQKEIDYYWEMLSASKESEQCGWLKDKFGISWQIVPEKMDAILRENPDATQKLFQMKKIVIADLQK